MMLFESKHCTNHMLDAFVIAMNPFEVLIITLVYFYGLQYFLFPLLDPLFSYITYSLLMQNNIC